MFVVSSSSKIIWLFISNFRTLLDSLVYGPSWFSRKNLTNMFSMVVTGPLLLLVFFSRDYLK